MLRFHAASPPTAAITQFEPKCPSSRTSFILFSNCSLNLVKDLSSTVCRMTGGVSGPCRGSGPPSSRPEWCAPSQNMSCTSISCAACLSYRVETHGAAFSTASSAWNGETECCFALLKALFWYLWLMDIVRTLNILLNFTCDNRKLVSRNIRSVFDIMIKI